MKKKGVADPKGGKPGDMYVHVQVKMPKAVDHQSKKLMEALKDLESDPRGNLFS